MYYWDKDLRGHRNTPKTITARFAADLARDAMVHGWTPEISAPPLRLVYRDGTLSQAVD
ncbi:MAG: hypothetical protein Rubg2KO_39160 [Rubricoccaceae bacterium]